jgi:hypothetical protein
LQPARTHSHIKDNIYTALKLLVWARTIYTLWLILSLQSSL